MVAKKKAAEGKSGTVKVKNVDAEALTVAGSQLFFLGFTQTSGNELWRQSFSVKALVDLALADDGALLVLGAQNNGGTAIKLRTDSSRVWSTDITSLR